jgi:hypothetical protein
MYAITILIIVPTRSMWNCYVQPENNENSLTKAIKILKKNTRSS